MANTQALRDLQTRLAERLQQVRTETPGVSWLEQAPPLSDSRPSDAQDVWRGTASPGDGAGGVS